MKAAVLRKPSQRMDVEDLVQEEPNRGEVRVRMMAAGLCASDHHVIEGMIEYPLPIVLGHEGSGIVESVGDGVESVDAGDAVILSFAPSCGRCQSCRIGNGHLCDTHRETSSLHFDGTTRLRDSGGLGVYQMQKLGVFAESQVVPEQACFRIEAPMPWESAALVGCAVTTGVGGVLNAPDIGAGATVAVFGCGGVGLNVIQGARLLNASRIIAVDVIGHKLEFAYKFGATDVLNARDCDPVEAILDLTGGGVDYAFDSFGNPAVIAQALGSIRKAGTAVLIGLPALGEEAPVDMVDMVRNQKRLVGSFYGSAPPHESFRRLLDFYRKGKLDIDSLVTRRYSLEEINEGFAAMARGEDGRGVITFND